MTEATTLAQPAAQQFDVSEEEYREYVFSNGNIFRIEQPVTLYILANGSHRVVDMNGVCHRPERGYAGIRWKQANGQPYSF